VAWQNRQQGTTSATILLPWHHKYALLCSPLPCKHQQVNEVSRAACIRLQHSLRSSCWRAVAQHTVEDNAGRRAPHEGGRPALLEWQEVSPAAPQKKRARPLRASNSTTPTSPTMARRPFHFSACDVCSSSRVSFARWRHARSGRKGWQVGDLRLVCGCSENGTRRACVTMSGAG
jgi:hypothetical protein